MNETNSSLGSSPVPAASRPNLVPIGTLLSNAFAAFQTRWQQFLGVAVLSIVPHLLQLLNEGTISDTPGGFVGFVSAVVAIVIYPMLFLVVIDGKVSRQALNTKAGPYIWIGILIVCVCGAASLFLAIAGVMSLVSAPASILVAPVSFIIALAVTFIAGIFFVVSLGYAAFALFIEDRRGTAALAASWFYVEGYWWEMFGRFLAISIFTLIIMIAIGIAATVALVPTVVLTPALSLIQYAIFMPISLLYSYEIYKNLRAIKHDAPEREAREMILRRRVKGLALTGLVSIPVVVIMLVIMASSFVYNAFNPNRYQESPPTVPQSLNY